MVRVRRLGAEFHHPDEFRSGLLLNMPYQTDYQAWQDYIDDNLGQLYERQSGGVDSNDDELTSFAYYRNARKAIWEQNYFRSTIRTISASVFSEMPQPIDASEEVAEAWKLVAPHIIRQARKSLEWRIGMGRGCFFTDMQYGARAGVPLFQATTPSGYLPLLHPYNRDIVLGHVFFNLWREGPRLTATDLANRITFNILVTPEGAEQSDGRLEPINIVRVFEYNGSAGSGSGFGTVGVLISETPGRLVGAWTYGDDDSIFGSMERNVFEALMHLSNARSALTRDVRPHQIVPVAVDPRNMDAQGTFVIDRYRPNVYVPVDEASGTGTVFGYVDPPGPNISAAFMGLHELAMRQLAYVAMVPPEEFGDNYLSGEPAQAIQLLKHTFLTYVIDTRDDLSPILSEGWASMGGPVGVPIGWESAPFVDVEKMDDRAIKLLNAGMISLATAQAMRGLPIEDTRQPERDTRNDNPE